MSAYRGWTQQWLKCAMPCVACLLLAAGCSTSVNQPTRITEPTFAAGPVWPPPTVIPHQVSDTQLTLLGRDWSLKSDRAYTDGNSLILRGGQDLPWGMYSIGYLSAENELQSVVIDSSWEPVQAGDKTLPYIGLANYHDDCWEWYSAPGSPWWFTFQYPASYRSADGTGYIVFALAGPGTAQLDQLTINVTGTVVPAPQNLTAESPQVGKVALGWDAVPNAAGYNIYRSGDSSLDAAVQVNDTLVTASSFEDSGMPLGRLYWYYVTAVAHNESEPSNSALVWTHQIELPAPLNPRVSARGETSFTVAWDWELANPNNGFVIFIGTWPDFLIQPDTERQLIGGFARESEINYRIPGHIYYWKMCARENGLYGRLTDELTGSTTGCWTWGDFEVIDTGRPPVRAVEADGKLAVTYCKDNSVMLATDQGDYWRIDDPLPVCGGTSTGFEQYGEYLDVAYNDGTFVVAAYEAMACDAWAAYGEQFDWHRDRVHGDGKVYPPLPPNSGTYCEAAINDSEMAVVHLFLTGESVSDPDDAELLVHRRPVSGGSWTTQRIRYFNVEVLPSHSICYHAGQLHAITTDIFRTELYTCDSEGLWTLVDVTPPGQEGLAKHHDLHWFDGQWYTPGFHYSQQELYMLTGIDPPWSDQRITALGEDMGHEARLAIEDDEAVMIFYGFSFGRCYYNFAVFSEGWEYRPIGVPHVTSGDYSAGADIVLMDGSPYFFFWDEGTFEIKVAKGTPPAD